MIIPKIIMQILFYMILPVLIYGQEMSCSENLFLAENFYKEGKVEKCIVVLENSNCYENGFTKEEKVRAYLQLIQGQLLLRNTIEAEEAMIHLLQLNPKYEPSEDDSPEFIQFYQSFRKKRILFFYLSIKRYPIE